MPPAQGRLSSGRQFSSTSSGMSKLAKTSSTSSCSSSASSSFSSARRRGLSTSTVLFGSVASVGRLRSRPRPPRAPRARRSRSRGLAEHVQLLAVLAHVLGAGVDRRRSGRPRRSARRRPTIAPFFSKIQATEPGSPRLPPCLVKAWRISALARLRLSVSASTRIATPAGPVALVERPVRSRRRRRRRRCRVSIACWILSFGIEASRAFCTAVARVGLPSVSPPPSRAATVIARASLLKSLPRLASAAPFLCLIEDHFE